MKSITMEEMVLCYTLVTEYAKYETSGIVQSIVRNGGMGRGMGSRRSDAKNFEQHEVGVLRGAKRGRCCGERR